MSSNASIKTETGPGLRRYLSPLNVWALSFGCAVGWGAFMMPGTTFLPIAGPLGTGIGMVLGSVVMLIIGANFHYMMNQYPDAGGTYTYAKRVFGYDHGFMGAWFLGLVYIAITWANATALPLIFRNLLGGVFQFGFHYQIAGFDVYLGEVLLSLFALWFFGALCMRSGKAAAWMQTVMALLLLGGVLIGFCASFSRHGTGIFHLNPIYPPGKSHFPAVFNVVALAPWAFVGFESVAHSTEEFHFSPKKSFLILFAAVAAGCAAYTFLTYLAAAAPPAGFDDWWTYIRKLHTLSGLRGVPTFYAVYALMGRTGLLILGITLLAAVITGLVGNSIAASRLIYSMARDNLMPQWFGRLNQAGMPGNAMLFILLISLPIPFLGRTAIGWIVDVNTIGATIAYAYTSAVAFKVARDEGKPVYQITGVLGMVISGLFFLYFMVPNFWTVSALTTESYLILVAWSILGFVFFRYIFRRDTLRRFGKSTIVWIALLFLIFFTSMLWLREATHITTESVLGELNRYNQEELHQHGIELTEAEKKNSAYYLQEQMDTVSQSLMHNSLIQLFLTLLALGIMFNIYNMMMERETEMEVQKAEAEQSNRAKSTFLSNMSHDIRTPMNAIVGYITLLKKEELSAKAMNYLDKIEASSGHLLSLINDVLEMSRIESGKVEMDPVKSDLVKVMDEVRDLFTTQMEAKHLTYTVTAKNVRHRMVLCDANRLNRVLLNLISNAYKFTPEGGSVTVTLTQTGDREELSQDAEETAEQSQTGAAVKMGCYELRVRDSGMGMSPEFAARVFEAYERERTVSNIQGTGLGMAITKSIVDLMGGSIRVETEQGTGTEFVINVDFPLVEEEPAETDGENEGTKAEIDFSQFRLLLVEDNEINREIAAMLLEGAGFTLDTAENGQEAVEKVSGSQPGDYQAVLMDVQMPVMDGYQATKAIRALDNAELAGIPIIAMTANAFTEDIQAAKEAGMDGHIAKPINVPQMMETLSRILRAC